MQFLKSPLPTPARLHKPVRFVNSEKVTDLPILTEPWLVNNTVEADVSAGPDSQSRPALVSEPVPGLIGGIAFMIKNVLTPEECQVLIANTEAITYEPAAVGISQTVVDDYRKSGRCVVDSAATADVVMERINHLLPRPDELELTKKKMMSRGDFENWRISTQG
jgi:hypothetical protein